MCATLGDCRDAVAQAQLLSAVNKGQSHETLSRHSYIASEHDFGSGASHGFILVWFWLFSHSLRGLLFGLVMNEWTASLAPLTPGAYHGLLQLRSQVLCPFHDHTPVFRQDPQRLWFKQIGDEAGML